VGLTLGMGEEDQKEIVGVGLKKNGLKGSSEGGQNLEQSLDRQP